MKNFITILLLITYSGILSAQMQELDSCNHEKFDFELLGNRQIKLIERCDGWRVAINWLEYREYPPDSTYYCISKEFYKNGKIKETGKLIPPLLKIGIWHYYNDDGCLIKTVDEDARFGKVKPEDLFKYIQRKKYNLGHFEEVYSSSYLIFDEVKRKWELGFNLDSGRTIYYIDSETGNILSKDIEIKNLDGETFKTEDGTIIDSSILRTKKYENIDIGPNEQKNIYEE